MAGKTMEVVAVRGFVGEAALEDGRKVDVARGETVKVSEDFGRFLIAKGKAAPPSDPLAKAAVAEVKAAAKK